MRRDDTAPETEPDDIELPGGWGDEDRPPAPGITEPDEGDEEEEGAEEEGGEDDKPLTPEEIRALRQRAEEAERRYTEAEELIGRQGEELGRYRQGQQAPIQPVQGSEGQQDPVTWFKSEMRKATSLLRDTSRSPEEAINAYADRTSELFITVLSAAGQGLREQIVSEAKGETDFFAKNSDLEAGHPRTIFEGEYAKQKVLNPRASVSEQRAQAAKATRELLTDMNWRLVDEDRAARAEGKKLQGARGRQSRTGARSSPQNAAQALRQSAQDYRTEHEANRLRTSSGIVRQAGK